MRNGVAFTLMMLGYLLLFMGGIAVFGTFLYGIFLLIFESVSNGLMVIGISAIGTFVVRLVSGILISIATAATTVGADE